MAEKVEGAPSDKAKTGKLWILILALVLVVAGILAFMAFSYFGSPKAAAVAGENASNGAEKRSSAQAQKTKGAEIKAALELAPFLVNLADKDSVCYLKATFQLGMIEDPEPTIKDSPVVMPAVRDTIISLLGSKTSDQILSTEGKNTLREEIRNRVNAVLPRGRVQEVYITDFVVSP